MMPGDLRFPGKVVKGIFLLLTYQLYISYIYPINSNLSVYTLPQFNDLVNFIFTLAIIISKEKKTLYF